MVDANAVASSTFVVASSTFAVAFGAPTDAATSSTGWRPSTREVEAEFSAYFGSYTVDPTERVITHHLRGSLNAECASGELRRNYELNDGALILTFTRPQDGATNTLVWKRMSRPAP